MNWKLIFSGFKSPGWTIYALVSVSLAIFLSVWLLRLERRLVSRTVGLTLLVLRGLVLLTLLFALFQPVLTKQFDVAQRGKVLVAIDGSLSMETQDRHASLAEKLRWAQALGMLGNADTAKLLDDWVAAAEAGQEPNWLGTETPPSTPVESASAEARSRQVQDSLNELAEMPRLEFVRRLLQSQPRMLLPRLEEVMPIDLRLFAANIEAAVPQELGNVLKSNRQSLSTGVTDALQTLQTVTAEENASQIRAVVLISDGRQTVPGDPRGTAQRLQSMGVPVFSIPIGSRLPPRDLSIAAIDAPEAVFLNDKAQVRAVIGTSGFEGESLTIRLERDGETIDEQTVTPAADSATVTFSIPTDKAGRYEFDLRTDVHAGELRQDNNVREISMQVVDNKARVMLVEGDARWEFRYLRNLLDRDKQVEPQTILFLQPWLQILNEPYLQSRLPAREILREQLSRTDLLIVGDLTSAEADAGFWDDVEQAVIKDGLTVLVIPGRRGMPHAVGSAVLDSLLPVTDVRQRLAEQYQASVPGGKQSEFQLTLTPEASTLPMLQLSENPAEKHTKLDSLPGHPWICAGTPKPGASVWAHAAIAGNDLAPEPVLIHQDYGFGQVVWLGIDSTWRWRLRAGDQWHYKFWGQLIRWAARNKASAGNNDVRMNLSDVIVDASEPVDATVRWNPKLLPQLEGAVVEVVASPVGEGGIAETPAPQSGIPAAESGSGSGIEASGTGPRELTATLKASQDAPERFTGRLPALPAGTWNVELRVTGGTLQLKERIHSELLVKQQVSAELANVACNRELLTQLSQGSGGELIEPWDAERLITLVQPRDQSEQKIQERSLWDHWLVISLFFVLLMAEWVLRKLNGLP